MEIKEIFKKPGTDEYASQHEYDKFFAQPIKMFAAAQILKEEKNGNRLKFYLIEKELLESIALSEKIALEFIYQYVEKVLKDSGIYSIFEKFFELQTPESYYEMRNAFYELLKTYTPIKKDKEPGRIFTKVVNPLAYKKNSKGTKRGRVSKDVITKDQLLYNQYNFRDIYSGKPKNKSRNVYEVLPKANIAHIRFQSNQAKKRVKLFNREFENEISQYNKESSEKASQMHHIFPAGSFPEISGFVENIIALTPNEHFLQAHPDNNTSRINTDFQKEYLIIRANDIYKYDKKLGDKNIYSVDNFLNVLSKGFDKNDILDIPKNEDTYCNIIREINAYYDI